MEVGLDVMVDALDDEVFELFLSSIGFFEIMESLTGMIGCVIFEIMASEGPKCETRFSVDVHRGVFRSCLPVNREEKSVNGPGRLADSSHWAPYIPSLDDFDFPDMDGCIGESVSNSAGLVFRRFSCLAVIKVSARVPLITELSSFASPWTSGLDIGFEVYMDAFFFSYRRRPLRTTPKEPAPSCSPRT